MDLAPNLTEARESFRAVLHETGRCDEEEQVLRDMTSPGNLPSERRSAMTFLRMRYDEKDDRVRALTVARGEEQLVEALESLQASSTDDLRFIPTGMSGREQLAAREEEAGEYQRAASDYQAARSFAKPGLYYDGPLFKIDMGRARSLRSAGQPEGARVLCDHWRRKVDLLRLTRKGDAGGSAIDWGGSDVARAIWEFSCSDYDHGVQELFDIFQARLHKPMKWGNDDVGYYLRAPLDALESAFLSRSESQLASQTRAIRKVTIDFPGAAQIEAAREGIRSLRASVHPHT